MHKILAVAVTAAITISATGCGVKGWVHQRTAPSTPTVTAPAAPATVAPATITAPTVVAPATTTPADK